MYSALVVWAVRDGRDAADQIETFLAKKSAAAKSAAA